MINQAQLVSMMVVMIGCLAIVLSPFIIYRKDLRTLLKPLLGGMVTYFIGDSILRFSIINMLNFDSPILLLILRSILSVAIAILFRVFVLRGILDRERQAMPMKTAIGMGLGHAAMESFLVGFRYLGHFQIANAINDGSIYDLVDETVTITQVEEAIEVLKSAIPMEIIGSLLILVFYIMIHIGLYLMIINALKDVNERQFALVSIIYLALVVSETVLVSTYQSIWIRLGVVFIFSLIFGYYFYQQRREIQNV